VGEKNDLDTTEKEHQGGGMTNDRVVHAKEDGKTLNSKPKPKQGALWCFLHHFAMQMFFCSIRPYVLLHLRFELSLEYMCYVSGPSFPYLRFSEFSTIPYHYVGYLG
jgi:hypothetical protein